MLLVMAHRSMFRNSVVEKIAGIYHVTILNYEVLAFFTSTVKTAWIDERYFIYVTYILGGWPQLLWKAFSLVAL